ncbi:DNA helicase II [Ectocarpus siliculosus]|uniref:DNA 3'-5' helicase n=1 Tax=Ectocarpus siliculosus TaxID=2880 RepID=D7FMX7_ECTSI|nr:DNA helicase II [Ectocarpus siliculosus]|eukprot:CBJ30041.1 DNA helicase II [Ectocarpus siliculosus]
MIAVVHGLPRPTARRLTALQLGTKTASAAAAAGRWKRHRRGHWSRAAGTRRGHPLSSVVHSGRASVLLDPAQEDVVLLDLETPAILLTAGAGTGKTHTLAARLARILGVEPRRPTELSVDNLTAVEKAGAGIGAGVGRLGRLHVFGDEGGAGKGGLWGHRRVAAHAAAPESVLVLSFTKQGAQDVRERAIAVGVPRAQADRVWAATFHSFAATVLKQNGHLLWPESEESDLGWSAASSRRRATFGLDMIGHAEQVDLVARILADSDRGGWDSRDDLAAASYKGDAAFEGPWSATAGGRSNGSWGMPPTKEERGKETAQRRKELETRAKTVLSRIGVWKEQGITVEEHRSTNMEADDYTDAAAAAVYPSYQQHLRRRRQVDFGDLCLMVTELFTRHPEVLERYRWRFRHVLVDEYQDTSPAQQRLLKALVSGVPSKRRAASATPASISPDPAVAIGEGGDGECFGAAGTGKSEGLEHHQGLGVSLFCAGDEDQHIYGWRGTTVDHLHRFEEDFPGAVRCALTETHRLPVHVLRSATGLMRAGGLVPLLNRRMRTKQHTPGAVVRAQGLWNSREEGKWVALEASKMNREQGISYKDMAVIARTAYNTRELEEALAARGVPYTVEGGSSFFSRGEVQAPLALLALCANPQDDEAFRRFISLRSKTRLLDWATPSTMRGVGELAVADGVSYAEGVRLSVSRGLLKGEDSSNFIYGLRRWASLLMGWQRLHEAERGAAVWRIFWEAGFLPRPVDASFAPHRGGGGGPDQESIGKLATAASRCDHIGRFLLRAARAREETANKKAARKGGEGRGRGGRWEGTTGKKDKQSTTPSSEDALEMMTMHQAKGREFKVVFLTGWDEGSFPLLPNSGDGEHAVESLERVQEERRLGYVALTRASENVIITFSKKRRFNDAWIDSAGPSRFLLEMPTEYVEVSPDAIGRTLNDYPGFAGTHRLAFHGMIEAGKLRRSRPVLMSASEIAKNEEDTPRGDDLPSGCTILNRNPALALASSDFVKPHHKSAEASDLDAAKASDGKGNSLLEAARRAVGEVGGSASKGTTPSSSVADDSAGAAGQSETSTIPPTSALNGRPTRDESPPPRSGSKSNALEMAWSSAEAFLRSIASGGGPGEKKTERSGRKESRVDTAKVAGTQPEAPGMAPVPFGRAGEPSSPGRPQHRQAGEGAAPKASPLRYNPGPTFRKSRGRRRKALLDPSGITAEEVVGADELLALLGDSSLQQASLKNYLRAVLAIQHGCVRGSIPVWRPDGGKKAAKGAASTSGKAALRGGLAESEATGRAALSTCSAQDLTNYIVTLLDARNKGGA